MPREKSKTKPPKRKSMRIEFNLFEDNTQWEVTTHQINSDILLRSVLTQGHVSDINLRFAYDERSSKGTISNTDNQVIGGFAVHF
ncbi:conserved hypothetical protein [Vibrio nigripulchritudo SOn1]|uniref:Porin n=2 Tax=Vibrio nigripulchritudo TaxID=28173 RepID=A0AAV2VRM2_9VIBR|nr:conserved hypothetical protein [Vibrio nigripulchritudo SOn1]